MGIAWHTDRDSLGRPVYCKVITPSADDLADAEVGRLFGDEDKRLKALALVLADLVATVESVSPAEARQRVRTRFRAHYFNLVS